MNLISMYTQKTDDKWGVLGVEQGNIPPYPQQQILKLVSTITKQRTFSAAITSPTLSGRNRIIIPSETVSFTLMQESKNIHYEYMFQVQVNLVTNLWRISATIVKNGRIINICKQGLVQMLCAFTLNINAYMTMYTLRIHPFTGIVKFVYISHMTKKQIADIFRFPVEFCEKVTQHIREMTCRLDERLLGKILHVTNQMPIPSILPTNLAAKLPEETPQYINKLRSANPLFSSCNLSSVYKKYRILKQTRKFMVNSTIKYSFLTKDPQTHKIRFVPDVHHRRQLQREHRIVRHNIKVMPFSRDVKKILAMYTSLETLYEENSIYGKNKNFDVSQIEPTPEQVKQIYEVLKIDNFITGGRILAPILMHSMESQIAIGLGGFAQISRVVVNISPRQQVQNPQSRNNQVKKIIRQILVRKSASKQKLFWQKSVIHHMGVGSCIFINKYYEPKLDAEAVGIDKTFLDSSIFMQYCQEKSLNNYLNKLSSIMSMKIKIFLLSQVTIGLRYLRDFGIVHLDMKPQNLLVKMAATTTTNAFALIKIIDFGQAYGQYLINKKINRGHTCPYASPELVRNTQSKYTQKSDVFSIGVMILIIVFQLNTVQLKRLTSAALFESNQKYIKFYSICVQKCKYLGYEPQMLSLLNLAYKCINPIPSSRPYLDWICVVLRSLLSMFECLEV